MTTQPMPLIRHEVIDGRTVTTLRASANSMGMWDRCPAALRMYKVLGRRPVGKSSGLIAGTALHDALPLWLLGKPPAVQEAAIDIVLAETPIVASEKEYRTAAYLKDAMAAFRVELETLFVHWVIEEIEQQGVIVLGETPYRQLPGTWATAIVEWEFRRDLVGVDPYGDRHIIDWKTMSQARETTLKAYQNSGQFLGYLHSWRVQHPEKPVKSVQPIRLVMRKPSVKGTGVKYEVPKDGWVMFSEARVQEWVRHTLRKARDILERDPANADDWPMAQVEVGCCTHQYGCCEYLPVCLLDPQDRPLKLSLDEFENSDAGKQDHENNPAD